MSCGREADGKTRMGADINGTYTVEVIDDGLGGVDSVLVDGDGERARGRGGRGRVGRHEYGVQGGRGRRALHALGGDKDEELGLKAGGVEGRDPPLGVGLDQLQRHHGGLKKPTV